MIQSRIEDRRRRVTIFTLIIHNSTVMDSDFDQDSMKCSLISLMNGMIFIYLFLFLNSSEWLKRGSREQSHTLVLFTKISTERVHKKVENSFSTQKERMPS